MSSEFVIFPDISFCFKTNLSIRCQGRDLFKRICTRPISQWPLATPLRVGCSWGGQGESLDAQTPEFACWSLLNIVHSNLKLSSYFFPHSLHYTADTIYSSAALQVCETTNRLKTQVIQKSIFIEHLISPSGKQRQCLSHTAGMDP